MYTGKKKPLEYVCKKTFSGLCSLNRHQKVNSREKRFECKVCKAFSNFGHLKLHQRVLTGEKSVECSVSKNPFRNQAF